jgi:glucoamylase
VTLSPDRPVAALATSGQEERRVPHLTSAIVGNGSMLVTLSARGETERLFWPHIDWGQHLGHLRLGLCSDGGTVWLDEPQLEHEQRYLEDANVVETTTRGDAWAARTVDFVCPDEPVLYRWVSVDADDVALVVYARPEIDESPRYGSVYVDRVTGALVFYRRGRAIAIALSRHSASCAGRAEASNKHSPVFLAADIGRVGGGAVEYGVVDGAITGPVPRDGALCVVACAETPDRAVELAAAALADGPVIGLERRRNADATSLSVARLLDAQPRVQRLYRRSLLAFDLLADRNTGAVIAAPEMDADFDRCGGYGFVWGRDMAYSLLAFLASGRVELAQRGVEWLINAQSPEGLWLHRHCADGSLAPSWGLHQIDETGAVIVALAAAAEAIPQLRSDPSVLRAVKSGADFLCEFRDPKTGLPLPSVDLWEERLATHTYTAAAVAGGLRAAAGIVADRAAAHRYANAAGEIREAIETHLWDESRGRYRRSLELTASARTESPLRYPDEIAMSALGKQPPQAGLLVDASLLGLAWPFSVIKADSERMHRTVAAIEGDLKAPGGGLKRYTSDTYAGGNAWILTTLWLGLWYRQIGDTTNYERCLQYAVDRQSAVGLLPEQVAADGTPSWVVPLTWSHAMFVLAAAPTLI